MPRRLITFTVLAVAVQAWLPTASGAPSPALAASRSVSGYLCTGYVACQQSGFPHAGYRQHNDTMYWRMYAGNNCTNYVAYRMVKGGMANDRPWEGSGNASNWGLEMATITNRRPRVGAVAWWKANVPPAGSAGHVAYVEEVVSRTEIIVSEDYWGGDFHWRRVIKGEPGWPSGFIHFNDIQLTSRSAPTVEGVATVGGPLVVEPGDWARSPTRFSFQWFADGEQIAGATGQEFTPTAEIRRSELSVSVTARRLGYVPGTATTVVGTVRRGNFELASPPEVQGKPRLGRQLSIVPATWSPEPTAVSMQWFADGSPIPGETGDVLTLTREQLGQQITLRTTVIAPGYRRGRVFTEPTSAVREGDRQRPPASRRG